MKVKGLHFRLVICPEDQNVFSIPPTQKGWRNYLKRETIIVNFSVVTIY